MKKVIIALTLVLCTTFMFASPSVKPDHNAKTTNFFEATKTFVAEFTFSVDFQKTNELTLSVFVASHNASEINKDYLTAPGKTYLNKDFRNASQINRDYLTAPGNIYAKKDFFNGQEKNRPFSRIEKKPNLSEILNLCQFRL